MRDNDKFEVISELRGHALVRRQHIINNQVECAFHQMLPNSEMETVGYRDEVYALKCPRCGVKAFAVKK